MSRLTNEHNHINTYRRLDTKNINNITPKNIRYNKKIRNTIYLITKTTNPNNHLMTTSFYDVLPTSSKTIQ
jgi:hypothetical protein